MYVLFTQARAGKGLQGIRIISHSLPSKTTKHHRVYHPSTSASIPIIHPAILAAKPPTKPSHSNHANALFSHFMQTLIRNAGNNSQ
jgi:hypothetical protein